MRRDILTNVSLFSKAFIMRSLNFRWLLYTLPELQMLQFVSLLLLDDMSWLPFFICVKVVILCQFHFPL